MKKRMFCLNVTDRNNVVQDESFLVVEKVNPLLLHELEELVEQFQNLENKSKMPRLLVFVKYLFLFAWILPITGIFMDYAEGMSFDEIYQTLPFSYFIAPISFLVFMSIQIYERRSMKNVEQSEQFQYLEAKMRKSEEDSFRQLGVPDDALVMDVLGYRYKVKNEQLKIVKVSGLFEYWNMVKRVYIKDDKLYFAALDEIVSIPLNSIENIKEVHKTVTIPSWNKDTPYNDIEYKKYGIKKNTLGVLICKPYYQVNIKIDSKEYELYIPKYEIEQFSQLVEIDLNSD